MIIIEIENGLVLVGRSQDDNFKVIDHAKQLDFSTKIWFHAATQSSAHVIILSNKKVPLKYGIELVKQYTPKLNSKEKIIYTDLKFVRKTNVPGQVLVSK